MSIRYNDTDIRGTWVFTTPIVATGMIIQAKREYEDKAKRFNAISRGLILLPHINQNNLRIWAVMTDNIGGRNFSFKIDGKRGAASDLDMHKKELRAYVEPFMELAIARGEEEFKIIHQKAVIAGRDLITDEELSKLVYEIGLDNRIGLEKNEEVHV